MMFYLAKLGSFFAATIPSTFSTHCNPSSQGQFFNFIPHWWEYLKNGSIDATGQCAPTAQLPGDAWAIGLAVLDMLIRVAGFLAVISIIIAGIEYIIAAGNPEKGAAARKRIINSLVGLAIVLVATAAVSFIGKTLG